MPLRLIILPRDGRGARSHELGSIRLALALAVIALAAALWLGWKIAALFG